MQLRDHGLDGRTLYEAACAARSKGARVVVNGRADVARAAGAEGVHLPTLGLPADAVRRWWPDALIGCSTHSVAEAQAAISAGADYLSAGPPYPTGDKPPIGLEGLRAVCAAAGRTPVYALGGVTPARAPSCRDAGAAGVACIRAVWEADDPAAAIQAFLEV